MITKPARHRQGYIDFGIDTAPIDSLRVDSAEASLSRIREVFADNPGPARDIVCLNAGAAIYVSGLADSLQAGIEAARAAIASGKAAEALQNLVTSSNA